jgi:UDP-N-acetylglucosamine 2-epimerase (non-hydrolysing)
VNDVVHVVGARPNFVKMAPIVHALGTYPGVSQRIVHTGQHYDARMSDEILGDLDLPPPDVFLGVGSGSHGAQTGRTLEAVERVLLEDPPALVCVGGDVNSTLATALAASKLGIPVAHVESGLRSFDWSMPEEINRVLTDRLSTLMFTHSRDCASNLRAEGIEADRVHFVGNTMVDSLRRLERRATARVPWRRAAVRVGGYVLVTLHRPSNVDDPERLRAIVTALGQLAASVPVVFPVHPRTRGRLDAMKLTRELVGQRVRCLEPLGYVDFIGLEIGAAAIVTDSGGVQEEASALGVPCYTLRANTERPITLTEGTNRLLGEDPAGIAAIDISAARRSRVAIEGWDGRAGERIARIVAARVAPELVGALA